MTKESPSHELIVSGADVPAPSGTIEVLYVDAHAAVRETTRSAMAAHRADISVAGVGTVDAALDVAATTPPSCLVIDPVDITDIESLLAAVDAPMILYSDRTAAELNSDLTEMAATIVEKGPTNRGAFLAEKVISAADSPADRSEYALQQALNDVTRRTETGQAVFLVDDEGGVVWSSQPLAALVGTTPDDTAGNLYDALAALCANTPDVKTVERFRERPTNPVTVRTALEAADQHLLLQGYRLPAVADSHTLVIVRDVTTTAGRAARLALLELLTERAQDGLYTLDERGIIDFCNESFATNLGYEPADLRGEHAEVTLAPGELEKGQRTISELLAAEEDSTTVDLTFRRRDGIDREMSIHYTLLRDENGSYSGLMGVVRDITERKEREREIESQRDELATLAQVHVLIQDVIRALGSAATRAEIKETVCEELVESDLYQFAWIGEREGCSTQLTRQTVAGDDDSYLDIVAERSTPETVSPGTTAIRTGEVQVVHDVETDDRMASWRGAALEREFRSAVVVPLRHDEAVHGVLAVYANRPEAFSQRAIEAFTVLGEMVGFAFTAVQNRQLLAHDRVVEMEFQSSSADAYFLGAASAHDCRIQRAGSVDVGDEALEYVTVEGAAPDRVLESLRDHELVRGARVIRAENDGGVIELRAAESYQSILLDVGVRAVDVVADGTQLTVTVEAPTDADARTIQETLTEYAPGFELVAKQERERRPTPEDDESLLTEELTERQLEVLRAAYLAGYYEWPRDTTAEELAETLDIASSTLHQHLRRAERNLFQEMLDI
ncbi:helix-turn-helix domain-containing protein [Haloarcula sp. S1CR25-12]|uniref:Helix-turn-helix domain-containing protein n=1 Tax=Haloarcula saliterrae TaxID=2950534 RepID=A0ABU2F6E8_9EURY|nr:bacterio-opsin activator domain-containing protein [Haloarcula sp. S1CR25-12]MDS0257834.1 helix-turn-helix domain-containing protein [Haloarcula sp. S1CR25-12]